MKTPKIMAFALLVSTAGIAQPSWARQRGPAIRQAVRAQVSEMVIARIVTALALDEQMANRMRAVVAKHGVGIEAAEQAQAQARRQLQQAVAARGGDATAYSMASDALLAAREHHRQLMEARQHELRATLTAPQFAMLLLEAPKIEREVRQQVMRAAGRGETPPEE